MRGTLRLLTAAPAYVVSINLFRVIEISANVFCCDVAKGKEHLVQNMRVKFIVDCYVIGLSAAQNDDRNIL